MGNEFPTISVGLAEGGKDNKGVFFNVSIPKIDETYSSANQTLKQRSLATSEENALQEFDGVIDPAVQLLAVAVASCNTCSVRQRGTCSGMQSIDFKKNGIYKALVLVSGVGDRSVHNATEQLSGANCRINPSQLNKLHPIKVG